MKKLLQAFEIISIIAKHQPLYLVYALPQIILNAALPILYVYFPKLIIDALTSGKSYVEIVRIIAIYACILVVINLLNVFLKNKSAMLSEIFSSDLKNEIGRVSMKLEFSDIENPKSQNIIRLANQAAELTSTLGLVQNIISNVITILGLAYIIIRLDWLFIALVFLTLAVKLAIVRAQFVRNAKIRELENENSKYISYLQNLSYSDEGASKEIRLNSLQGWFMRKTKLYREEMLGIHFKLFRQYALDNIISAAVFAVQSFIILSLLAARYADGIINIADFTMYFAAVSSLSSSLAAIAEQVGEYNRQTLNLSGYKDFLGLEKSPNTAEVSATKETELIFYDVSFAYPNADAPTLKNINITIKPGEKLVLVGANGAGKSTFVKLICKFYRPSSGKITLGGVDIWEMPNPQYYKIISAVFQDFENFSFSVGENIAMSESFDESKVIEAAQKLGLDKVIDKFDNGCETYLSKKFDESGVELSGGQAQKLAMARALYKDTPILILDEPTANLDPQAESEIYRDFFETARDKTAIFISHRLAASSIADNIAVFDGGEIIEYGTHDELLVLGGVYAKMYEKQSRQYVDEAGIF